MQLEVEVNGRTHQVAVQRAGSRFAVAVDGRWREVDAARVDRHTLSLIMGSGASYDVGLAPGPATGALTVRVGATRLAVSLGGRRRDVNESPHGGSGPQRIVAPMPGKIVRVGVKPGEAVRVRQTVVVIEAMKMENELAAGRDGTVAELHAQEGASVEAGALLVVIR